MENLHRLKRQIMSQDITPWYGRRWQRKFAQNRMEHPSIIITTMITTVDLYLALLTAMDVPMFSVLLSSDFLPRLIWPNIPQALHLYPQMSCLNKDVREFTYLVFWHAKQGFKFMKVKVHENDYNVNFMKCCKVFNISSTAIC